jgi:hypothetical protein
MSDSEMPGAHRLPAGLRPRGTDLSDVVNEESR